MKKKKMICMIVMCLGVFGFTAWAIRAANTNPDKQEVISQEQVNDLQEQNNLEGKSLFVYCGAGMTKPFTEIVESFQNQTGAAIEVTYANTAQIISQIKASSEGDLFIAGDQGELSAIQKDYIIETKSLVKHIPLIVVQEGNPKGVTKLADLDKEDVTVILGDNEATPIGKISDKALTDTGILESVNVAARTTTAPEIATALSLGQCDAAIIWKENTNVEGVEIVETTDMEPYIKTVPAASLKCSTNTEVLEAFLSYLDSDAVKEIWEDYGYEILN